MARKGWKQAAPKTKARRRALLEKCGSGCFGDPKKLAYPICKPKKGVCEVDCRGALAAFSRARQQKNAAAAKRALKAAKRSGCAWFHTGTSAQRLAKRWKI